MIYIFTWSTLHSEFAGASVLAARVTSSDSFRFIDDTSSKVEDMSWTRYRFKGFRYDRGIKDCSLCEISGIVTHYAISFKLNFKSRKRLKIRTIKVKLKYIYIKYQSKREREKKLISFVSRKLYENTTITSENCQL